VKEEMWCFIGFTRVGFLGVKCLTAPTSFCQDFSKNQATCQEYH
jgi:hypothetical protein